MLRGRPHASRLRQVESYLKDTGMTGLTSVWAMARRRPREYRRKVDVATRCSGACPHTDLTCNIYLGDVDSFSVPAGVPEVAVRGSPYINRV